jgi:hypothetical protein
LPEMAGKTLFRDCAPMIPILGCNMVTVFVF